MDCHAEHTIGFTGLPLGRNGGAYSAWDHCQKIADAKVRCEAARWPELHRDDCAWCGLVREERTLREELLRG